MKRPPFAVPMPNPPGRSLRQLLLCCACLLACAVHAATPRDPRGYAHPQEPDRVQRIEHTPWQAFLDRYLVTTEDGRTLVRYGAVSAEDRGALHRYLQSLAAIDPGTFDRDEQYAYWINLYNALTVEVVLRNPEKDTIKRMGKGLFSTGPWDDVLITIGGRPLTLDDIEHRILRPTWKDRRVHFAVNCASVSCPNLAQEAYTSANLDRLLDAGERAYLSHPRALEFQADGTLQLSSILDWYRKDFAADEPDLLRYLARFRPDLADRLLGFDGRIRYVYDWSLNAADD